MDCVCCPTRKKESEIVYCDVREKASQFEEGFTGARGEDGCSPPLIANYEQIVYLRYVYAVRRRREEMATFAHYGRHEDSIP
ncbi:hypothetical protein GW17_00051978 [Ensete ventricosum]|nr:hypothetical protein GW17_00051978 [Ensete ventricosum]